MSEKRYTIAYKDISIGPPHVASLLGANLHDIIVPDNISSFATIRNYTEKKTVVHLQKIGISYAWLKDEQVASLKRNDQILSITEVGKTEGGGEISIVDIEAEAQYKSAPNIAGGSALPWNLALIRADEAWGLATGKGIKIAVLDTGIDRSSPVLSISGGVSYVPGNTDWNDDHNHGTCCASIIGAIAKDSSLYAVKVLDSTNSGNSDWTVLGLMWAADNKMDIVSMSIWEPTGVATPNEAPSVDIERAAQYCLGAGCLVVGIVGNGGSAPNHWVANYGRCPSVMGIGAIDANKDWWSGSCYGPASLLPEQAVELVAPGVNVPTLNRNHQNVRFTGTSAACPHVAAASALMKSADAALTPLQLRQRLDATAEDLLSPGRDDKSGNGLLNCYAAISTEA